MNDIVSSYVKYKHYLKCNFLHSVFIFEMHMNRPHISSFTFLFLCFLLYLHISPNIEAQQFGKNKVQYQSFDWKIIKTKHFDVYFAEEGEYLARYAGIIAEKSLISIEKRLSYSITKRISLIIYNSHNEFQQTNVVDQFMQEGIGGVTELFKNRVTLPFEGVYDQFNHVIHHELVHAVLNDMFYGGSVQNMVSNNIRTEIPLWMNEGLAEYEGNGGYDTQTDMFMRDMALSEYLKDISSLNGYLAYRGGQAFYWYIAEKYGERKIGELINRLRISSDLSIAFKGTFGKNLEDFSEEWIREMKKKYLPDLDKFQGLDEFAKRITNHEKDHSFYNSSPAISPDGDQLAFISNRDDFFGVFLMDLNSPTKETIELISSGRSIDFEELNILTPGISWSPDGKKLVVSAKSGGEDALYIVDVKTGDYQKKLFGIRSLSSALWSPDGSTIAFVASVGEQPDMWLYDVKTGEIIRATDDIFTDMFPAWSPDSKTLYFISDRADNTNGDFKAIDFAMWRHNPKQSDIYSLDIETKSIERLSFDPYSKKTSLAATNDGKNLLYVSDQNGIGNVYSMDLNDLTSSAKTNSISGMTQISLSKDASTMFFTSQIKGGYDLFELRFPLERTSFDSLPLTKFKISEKDNLNQLSSNKIIGIKDTNKAQKLIGYGKAVEIEFSRQQIIQPNKEISQVQREPTESTFALYDNANIEDIIADTALTPVQDYKISFSNDIILSNASFNTFWGYQGITQMLFSDMLGDHQIYFQANLFLDLRNSNFLLSYTYLPDIIDWQVSAQHNVGFGYSYRANSSYVYLYRFRNFGLNASGSYPLSRFRRIELGTNWLNLSKENIEDPTEPSITKNYLVAESKMVFDNTAPGWYGPSQGTRYSIGIKATPKLSENTSGFASLNGDFRQYFTVSEDLLWFAIRGTGGLAFSTNPDQRFYFVGGTDNWINRSFANNTLPFQEPEDFAFMNYALPLRGWSVNERNGSKFFLMNAELRFPLFRALLAGPIPVMIQAFQGALFMDIGTAFTNDFSTKLAMPGDTFKYFYPQSGDMLMSTGIGIRSFLIGLPIRVDIAWRNQYIGWSEPQWMFSIGGDF